MKNVVKLLTRSVCLIILYYAFFVCAAPALSPAAMWNREVRITNIQGQSWGPQIAAYNGTLHTVWFEYPNPLWTIPEVYYSRSSDNGDSWSMPQNISNDASRVDSFPVVAADVDGVYVFWSSDSMNGDAYFRRSTDGGTTWQPEQKVTNKAGANPYGYSRATSILVDNQGHIHLVWYDSRNVGWGQVYHRQSCDHGVTWTPEENVTQFDGSVDNEQPKLVQGPDNNLYILFRSSRNGEPHGGMPPFDMYVLRSKSLGCPGNAVWLYPTQKVSRGFPEEYANTYSGTLLAGINGTLHLAYWDELAGSNVIYRKGAPTGAGWGLPIDVSRLGLNHPEASSGNLDSVSPGMAEDSSGRIHAFFSSNTVIKDNITVGRLYYASGDNNGLSWEPPLQLGAGTLTTSPKAVYSNDRVHVVWIDYRDNNYGSEIYYRNLDFSLPSLVDHYYTSILKREPDTDGKSYWEEEITRTTGLGMDLKEAYMVMAGQFYNGQEYLDPSRSETEYLIDLYLTFFNRSPDQDGLTYWSSQLASYADASLSDIARNMVMYSFLFSQEFYAHMTGLYGDTNSRAEVYVVVDFYRGALARLADNGGFSYWIDRFRAAQCQGSAAVIAEVDRISSLFFNCQEYVARQRSNSQCIQDLYYAFMRRYATASEVSYWKGSLDSAEKTRDEVRRDFLYSAEFQTRVAAVMNQGCPQ